MSKKEQTKNTGGKFIQPIENDNLTYTTIEDIEFYFEWLNDIKNNKSEKIRLYGNYLGTTSDLISFFNALETNYRNILAFFTILTSSRSTLKRPTLRFGSLPSSVFYQYQKYDVNDIISPDAQIHIVKANFNSPGFWDVIGEWNPLNQIRKYIKERHERTKDKQFGWDMERQRLEAEIEHKKLSNDLLKLEATKEMISLLKTTGISDIELRFTIQKYFKDLHLLDSHIDSGRITRIEKVTDNNSEDEDK